MKVLNFGSLNLDHTYQVPHIVAPGETLTSLGLAIHPGGKGLNQSVALAKAGAEVFHAGQIGEDGEMLRKVCADSGADVRFIRNVETRTGNAIIHRQCLCKRYEDHPESVAHGRSGAGM